jgi:rhamnose utilization protein RhaD (predicted bifunctional aldolase and dehydrogenase)
MAERANPRDGLSALVDAFLSHAQLELGLADNTIQAYSRDLARFADFLAGEGVSRASELGPAHLVGFAHALERDRLSANMEGNRVLVMRNHGFLAVGETAGEAFMVMHYFVRGCRALLAAHASGLEIDSGPTEIWELAKRQYDGFPLGKHEWPALCRLMDQIDPSYRQ